MVWGLGWRKEDEGCLFCLLKKTNPLKADISHRNITSSKPDEGDIFFFFSAVKIEISLKLGLNGKRKNYLSHRRFLTHLWPPPPKKKKKSDPIGDSYALLDLMQLPTKQRRWQEGFWMCQLCSCHIMPTWCTTSPVYGKSTCTPLNVLKIDSKVSYMKIHPAPGIGKIFLLCGGCPISLPSLSPYPEALCWLCRRCLLLEKMGGPRNTDLLMFVSTSSYWMLHSLCS